MASGFFDFIADFSFKRLAMHPVTWMLGATLTLVGIGSFLWQSHYAEIVGEDGFKVALNKLEVSAPPEWVPDNWTEVAFHDSRLAELSILEVAATEKIAAAFSVQPWVRNVERVTKTRGKIQVDLVFRQPVGLVYVGDRNLIPVDGEAVVFDGKYFSKSIIQECFIISIRPPIGGPALTGQQWPDRRIQGAAAIAEAWGDDWQQLGLLRVVNRSFTGNAPAENLQDFELWTKNDTPIIWGRPPGREAEHEATAAEKILALKEFVETNGSLDQLATGMGLDVRSGELKIIPVSLTRNFENTATR